jgi:hypothetical protein
MDRAPRRQLGGSFRESRQHRYFEGQVLGISRQNLHG